MLIGDVRYAARSLRKAPVFAVTAVVALALGIGANVAVFSLVDALLLRPLPLAHPDRLVQVWEDSSFMGFPRDTPAPANFVDWKQRNHVFTDMGALRGQIFAITGDGQPQQVEGNPITANLFPLLGVSPILGRNILPEEDQPGNERVALISHRLWQQRYGGSRSIVGKAIVLDGIQHRIIGVMPPGFVMPDRSDVWVPIAFTPQQAAVRSNHSLQVYARLRPGVTVSDAQRDMSAIAAQLTKEYPATNRNLGATVVDLRSELLGDLQLALWVLSGGVAAVLLISCANLAGLLLARSAERQREMAIRAALGAGRWRLARHGLVESLVIAVAGGMAAILLSAWIVPAMGFAAPRVLLEWAQPKIDWRLLAFTGSASLVAAALCGAIPALRMARVDLAETLQQGGRGGIGSNSRLRRFLVAGEVALAMMLCVGAGLMLRTVWGLAHVDLGFHTEGVLTMRTSLPMTSESRYRTYTARSAFYEDVVQRVRAIPGVVSAGYTTFLPLTNRGGTSGFLVEGAPPLRQGEFNDANRRAITAGYFQTLGVRLMSGRFFNEFDGRDTQPVAIINEAMAGKFWPAANPVGKRFRFMSNPAWFTIVGVVGNVRQMGLDVTGRAEMYFPSTQEFGGQGFFAPRDLAVRVSGDPMRYAGSVRQAIWAVDHNQPISDVMPLEALVSKELSTQKLQLTLLGSFAVLALALAVIGLYGLLSHLVAERTREIGVRMALGARRSQVLAGIMRQGLGLVLSGVACGAAGAWWLTQLMRKLLYGVKPNDLATFGVVILALVAAGCVGCYIPALRATRIDPMQALRHD